MDNHNNTTNAFEDPLFGLWGKKKMLDKLKTSLLSSAQKRQLRAKLGDMYALQRHRAVSAPMLKKLYRRVSVARPFDSVQLDVAFLPHLKSSVNNNVIGFVCCIDTFSRYLWVKTITNRREMHIRVNQLIDEMERDFGKKPINITADNEFATLELQRLVAQRLDGRLYLSEPHEKFRTGIVERVIRTLKNLIKRYLTQYDTIKYVDILPQLVQNYNDTIHDEIRTRPNVSIKTGQSFPKIDRRNIPKLQIGDKVRVLDARKRGWTKGDVPYYSKEVYVVSGFDKYRYRIKNTRDPNDPRSKRSWAVHQLLRIRNVIKHRSSGDKELDEKDYENYNDQGYDEQVNRIRKRNRFDRRMRKTGLDADRILNPAVRREIQQQGGHSDDEIPRDEDLPAKHRQFKHGDRVRIKKEPHIKGITIGSVAMKKGYSLVKNGKHRRFPAKFGAKAGQIVWYKAHQLEHIVDPYKRKSKRRNLRSEEIRPKPKPKPKKKTSPETESDFEREEERINKLIEKYDLQGKFHLAHKTRERLKKLLNTKKSKNFAPKRSIFQLPKQLQQQQQQDFNLGFESSSSNLSDSSESESTDTRFRRQINNALQQKNVRLARRLKNRYSRWKRKNKK